jgi:hypothetical protein
MSSAANTGPRYKVMASAQPTSGGCPERTHLAKRGRWQGSPDAASHPMSTSQVNHLPGPGRADGVVDSYILPAVPHDGTAVTVERAELLRCRALGEHTLDGAAAV